MTTEEWQARIGEHYDETTRGVLIRAAKKDGLQLVWGYGEGCPNGCRTLAYWKGYTDTYGTTNCSGYNDD